MTQQTLGRHDNEGLAVGADHLPAQHMEHLRRGGGHADLHVVFSAKLQESLEPRGRVLRSLPFVAVRQEKRHAAETPPLRIARTDELVDHDLRAVREVAELAFPDNERRRVRCRVAVLEAEYRLLGQQ